MKRTWRVLLAGFVTGVVVLASAGVAQAGSLDETGGDSNDSGHHKKQEKHKKHKDDSDDATCSGCVGEHEKCCENEPVDYCEECAESCEEFALDRIPAGIPGLGSVPVVRPSESECDD